MQNNPVFANKFPTDFSVMPAEMLTVSLKPANFFEGNPSNDVPWLSLAFNKSTLVTDNDNRIVHARCCDSQS